MYTLCENGPPQTKVALEMLILSGQIGDTVVFEIKVYLPWLQGTQEMNNFDVSFESNEKEVC